MTKGDIRWIENWKPKGYITNMNKFYRKPKPETMKKNREFYAETFEKEIKWLKDNVSVLTQFKNKFLLEMYTILISGSRKMTPKMVTSTQNGIEKCKKDPRYNSELREQAKEKLNDIQVKIAYVKALAEKKNDKGIGFIKSVENYANIHYTVTRKQMDALNKIYKRVSENLFEKGGDNESTNNND